MNTEVIMINLGGICSNCYLISTEKGFILIDTGRKPKRKKLVKELMEHGCIPGKLDLIILTHGDFDHSGNAAYLRNHFGSKIAMHSDDVGMVENNNMFWNRKKGGKLARFLINTLVGLSKTDRFTPDITVEDGSTLSEFGLDGKILSIPGHSKGSIGILTTNGNFFCGDLFSNIDRPEFNSNIDNLDEIQASAKKLDKYKIKTFYPGHGTPFVKTELNIT